jgi:hypothetical protein
VREGDDQQANGECNRGEGDRRSKRAHSGHSTSETEIHPGTDEAAYRRAEGEGGCARLASKCARGDGAASRTPTQACESSFSRGPNAAVGFIGCCTFVAAAACPVAC